MQLCEVFVSLRDVNFPKDVRATFFRFSVFLQHSFGEVYVLYQDRIHWEISASASHGHVRRDTETTVKTVTFFRFIFSPQLPPTQQRRSQ